MIFDGAVPRQSPIAAWHATQASAWRIHAGMALPAAYRETADEHAPVILQDLSWRVRCGCKGPRAEQWLSGQGISVPPEFNSWRLRDGILTARLAMSEFLIECCSNQEVEHSGNDELVRGLLAKLSMPPSLASGLHVKVQEDLPEALRHALPTAGVYPVIRQDLAIGLRGLRANDLLLETCSVDFRELLAHAGEPAAHEGRLALTSMIGVAVTIAPRRVAANVEYTIWCDPSFGPYLWTTLVEIAKSLHGGVLPSP
jgi:sarcosine oxidase subunit gamma